MKSFMIAVVLILGTGSAWASGVSMIQGDDGTSGTLYDFGGVKLYNDSRGTTGTVYDFGTIQRYQFNNTSGETSSGTIYRFPQPQAHSTLPAPSVPVTPLLPVIPYGGGVGPQSHPGGGHWRGGTGR
jgi:hypothetical protein